MKKFLTYTFVISAMMAITLPVFAEPYYQPQLDLPKPPTTGTTQALTGSGIVNIITQGVNYFIALSVVVAIAFFIWGAVQYVGIGKPEEGTAKMKQAALGLLAILGVGLLINTIAGLINRGLNLG